MSMEPARIPWYETLLENWRDYYNRPVQRIGFWFGVLLLFAPVFYILLWYRRYSVTARVSWGIWLGFIVFVKLNGLAEPVFKIDSEFDEPRPSFATKPQIIAPKIPSLESYLLRLEAGALGGLLTHHQVEGKQIALHFEEADRFFEDLPTLAQVSAGVTFAMIYGRDFDRVILHYQLAGEPITFDIAQPQYEAFFELSTQQMLALGEDRDQFAQSVIRNLSKDDKAAFISRFLSKVAQ